MSANNWTTCPRCLFRANKRAEQLKAGVQATYGKVNAEEYLAALKKAERECSVPIDTTFREDWEIYGANEGAVTVSYSGNCHLCKLSLSFSINNPIEGIES